MRKMALVADDDLQLLDAVAAGLEEVGMEVQRATNGAELVQRLAQNGAYDVVVTDISMPWTSGLQAVRRARSAGLTMPVVLMTALRDEQLLPQVAALGENVVLLRKPFGLDALLATVTSLLAKR